MTSPARLIRRAVAIAALGTLPTATAAAQATVPVTFSGEIRVRTEWDRPGGGLAEDVYTYLRTRLGVGAAPTDGVRLMFQLQDSRVYGVAASSAAGNPDITDLHQAYVDLYAQRPGREVTARVGRQEIAFGNERLVGPVGWSNTGRTFDGARLTFTPSGDDKSGRSATFFLATVEERGRHFGPTTATGTYPGDRAVAGAFLTRNGRRGTVEFTALYDNGAKYRSYTESSRYTLYGRFHSAADRPFGLDLEAAWQGGTQQYQATTTTTVGQDVSAWLLAARVGRQPAPGRKGSAILGVDVLSGDATPKDGRYHAFNTMYATNHPLYGLMDLFTDPAARTNDAGLVDAFGSVTRALNERTSLRADLHHFAAQAGSAGEIGWEVDLIAPVKLSSASALEVGYTAFRAGTAAAAMGLGAKNATRQWGYVQLRAAF